MLFAFVLTCMWLPQDMGEKPVSVQSTFTLEKPEFQLDGSFFRPWEELGAIPSSKQAPQRSKKVPSATVEVVESVDMDRQQRFLDFKTHMAPQLRFAFNVGHELRFNKQMLREFVAADPSHPHPPSVPSVFYNTFKPPEENPALQEMKRRQ